VVAAVASALLPVSCGGRDTSAPPTPCSELETGESEAAAMILAGGPSDALRETLETVAKDPERLFRSEKLGLDTELGIVVVSTYDQLGEVSVLAAYNLEGVAGDEVRRKIDAERQKECLQEVADLVPAAGAKRPNLLRALRTADDMLLATGAERTALIVHGFADTDSGGFEPAKADLSADQRANVMGLLLEYEVVPTISHPMLFIAPAAGVEMNSQATDIESFVNQHLCPALTVEACESANVLL